MYIFYTRIYLDKQICINEHKLHLCRCYKYKKGREKEKIEINITLPNSTHMVTNISLGEGGGSKIYSVK